MSGGKVRNSQSEIQNPKSGILIVEIPVQDFFDTDRLTFRFAIRMIEYIYPYIRMCETGGLSTIYCFIMQQGG